MNAAVVAKALEEVRIRLDPPERFGMTEIEMALAQPGMLLLAEEVIKANIRFTENHDTLMTIALEIIEQKNREYGDGEDDPLIDGTVDSVIAGMV